MKDKKDKYSDLFYSPDDGEMYADYNDGEFMGYGEIAPFLAIHKDSGENLSNPRRMAKLNGYYDATARGGDVGSYLKNYGGVKFDVDMRTKKDKENGKKVKSKDYTNVYLNAYKRALKNPEIYGERYRDTGSYLGNLVSATRRAMFPNNFAGGPEKEGRDFTRDYIEAQNEYAGYSPSELSIRGYEETPVKSSNIYDEYRYVSGEKTAPAGITYKFGQTRRRRWPVVYIPAEQRLEVGRTGSLSNWQKGLLPHEFNHAAEQTGFSQGYDMDAKYGEAFRDLERKDTSYDDWSMGYKWDESPAELRSEVVAAMRMYGIDPKTRFVDLNGSDQYKIIKYLAKRLDLDEKKYADLDLWFDILNNEDNNFHDGGRLGRLKRLFGF